MTALDDLVAALRELHTPRPTQFYVGSRNGGRVETRTTCWHCDTGDPGATVSMDWPCPTIALVEEHAP